MTTVSTQRKTCRLCGSHRLSLEIQVPLTYIADKYASAPNEVGELYGLDLYQCQTCGHVQVINILPLELLFASDYTYKPSRSPKLIEHFLNYANRFSEEISYIPKKVLDIGSNDGLFLKCMQEKYSAEVLGIDPAEEPVMFARNNNIKTEQDFFNRNSAKKILNHYGQFDVISANNVFAHNDDLEQFAESVSLLLESGGVFSFEISYLIDIVEKTLIGTIFHEHLSHHSLYPLRKFLEKFNLHLFHAVRVDSQGGSLQCFASKQVKRLITPELEALLSKETQLQANSREYMQLFRSNISLLLSSFNEQLNILRSTSRRIIGYGAARSANLLIEQLQLSNKLNYILDDNQDKVGKYIYDSNIPIFDANKFKFLPGDLIIPLAWIHSDTIYEKLALSKDMLPKDIAWLQFYPIVRARKFHE